MIDTGEKLKNLFKNKAKKKVLAFLLQPHVLAIAGIFFLILLGVFLLLGIFGTAYDDGTVNKNGARAQEIETSLNPPILSTDKMEKQFFLPYGIPYAIELYATDWNDTLNKEMVSSITKELNPIFTYTDFTETIETITSTKDSKGEWHTTQTIQKIPQKFITVANTYAGVYTMQYKVMNKKEENDSSDVHQTIITTYLQRVGMDFSPDWTRLDAVIAKYASKNIPFQKTVVKGGQIIYPFDGDYQVTSPFGSRNDPMKQNNVEFHTGIDFGVPLGTPIKAVADGVVVQAGSNDGYGNSVTIDHGGGMITLYGHLSKVMVSEGQKVKQVDVIGLSGNTGRSNGPHLHFEIRQNGQPVDPSSYLSGVDSFSGGEVNYVTELNRVMLLETSESLMTKQQNVEWLLSDNVSFDSNAGSDPHQVYNVNPGEVPQELLPVFKAAGSKYNIPWVVLAAIAYRESSFNPNAIGPYLVDFNTSAEGMMQFLPSTFQAFAVDGNNDGVKSVFEPEDAIYTAANYLSSNYRRYKAQDMSSDDALRKAIWDYNHAWWYVDQVMSIADKYAQKYNAQ
ncbi:M23 family metallopeptidase [Thermoanaerobacterium sp. RBIITD]|uniref:M23 family metallopeptidase n=1 Tax=Thermoanaerobacterium sp. RBIITD TaxID=1550240 RepID=UPI000BB82C87|nr:M23 family metallopeptidase [Thermoanaerobacterium sp. RBIITD]SNX54084.1 Transglycosylase SLT domain-containing protein [Thermoanaerobacterium sp. RBIITD]